MLERYAGRRGEKPELRRTISCNDVVRDSVLMTHLGIVRGDVPYVLRSDPDSFVIDFKGLDNFGMVVDDVEQPPPSYESLSSMFVRDEPPKYEVVTGKKLHMELIDTKVGLF